jgi:lipid-binding SYLF domain-containing protein
LLVNRERRCQESDVETAAGWRERNSRWPCPGPGLDGASLLGRVAGAVLLLVLGTSGAGAGPRELRTLEDAAETLRALSSIPLRDLPQSLLQEAQGVAIIPNVLRAGFVVDGRFGRGVVLARQGDGRWGNPVFIVLVGGGLGWQLGVQSTDLVLIFMTRGSVDRLLQGKGKLTLGGDVSVAAGPLGREAAAATDGQLRAEIYSYSRSRGLFAGLSLEGAGLLVDHRANAAFYGRPGGPPGDCQTARGALALADLHTRLNVLSPPAAVVVPAPTGTAPAVVAPPVGVPAPPPSPPPVVVPAPPPAGLGPGATPP